MKTADGWGLTQMKVANIILSILILIMALASAAFSYFLFEKRDALVNGWGKLATAIHNTSKTLDTRSATNVASKLTPTELSHEKYSELDSKLQALTNQSRKIIAERDELADALRRIGSQVGVKKLGSEADFRAVGTYAANKDAVVRGVSDALARRDAVYKELANISRQNLEVTLNVNTLVTGGASGLAPLDKALRQVKTRREVYEGGLRTIASQAGVSKSDFSESAYADSTRGIRDGVKKIRTDLENTSSTLDDTRRELIAAKDEIKKRDAAIAGLNGKIGDLNYTINGLKKTLGIAEPETPVLWRPGSKEVRAKVIGEVVKVNRDYGYIAINLGKNTLVKQPVTADKFFDVNPEIKSGMTMVIARGSLDDDAAFITRITLDEVGDDCSTANIPAGANTIKVGDFVYFDKAELK